MELHVLWPRLRPWCELVIAKTGDRCLPDDVYAEVRAQAAFLYLVTEVDNELGFVVARRVLDPDGPVLFVWMMYAEPEMFNRDDFLHCLDDLARSVGAIRVRGYSPRGGFMEGWGKLVMHIYEREIKE